MTKKEALKVLEDHQKWRLGDDEIKATNPKELTKAIKVAIASLSESMEGKYGWRKASKELPESVIGFSKTNPGETNSVLVKLRNGNYAKDKRIYLGLNNACYCWFWYNYTNKEVIEWKIIDDDE